jgi:transcriptional regulator with GAF, ATPase, and Fis domain
MGYAHITPSQFADHRRTCVRSDGEIVGRSAVITALLHLLERVAPTETPVLITGETGTGKEVTARALHQRSRRARRPFIAVNLAAIPEALVAAELFGYEPGAFTGASQRRQGRFELADGGTLFLDEIGELPAAVQVALLRVLQEGEFERLGSGHTRSVDVRLVAATNRNLEQAVAHGNFREDLFYRLSVFPLHLPPLRDRREDVPLLVECLLRRIEHRLGRRFGGVEPESVDRLARCSWPGNIRQLQNVLERSAILCDEEMLYVPAAFTSDPPASPNQPSALEDALDEDESRLIEDALERTGGRVSGASGAAATLGIPASTLESKIRRLKIDKYRYRTAPDGPVRIRV